MRACIQEILNSFFNWNFWLYLGWSDIRRRYERTVIGPFWSVLNAAFFVLIVGFCYSSLFGVEAKLLLPHLAAGYFIWTFLVGVITESCSIIYSNGIVLKTSPVRTMDFILRMITKHFIVFMHNLLLLALIGLYFQTNMSALYLVIVGLVLLIAFIIPLSLFVAIICCRFRDVEQIISSLILILFFVTPVLWLPSTLNTNRQFIIEYNIIYHFIEIVRAPMISGVPALSSYYVAAISVVVTWFAAIFVFSYSRKRLAFWY